MANLGATFRPEDAPPPDNDFEVMPAGDYMAQVIESEIKKTNAGTGEYLKLTLEIMNGPYTNRRVWSQLNIRNPSEKAQGIALRSLAELCAAVGIPSVDDSDELHFKPMTIRLVIKNDKNYGDKNEIKKFIPLNGGAPRSAAPRKQEQQQSTPQQQSNAPPPREQPKGSRPWASR